jgi:hypothetical protein
MRSRPRISKNKTNIAMGSSEELLGIHWGNTFGIWGHVDNIKGMT